MVRGRRRPCDRDPQWRRHRQVRSFSADCWTTGGEGWKLYKCARAGNIAVNTDGKTWFYRLHVLNQNWRRKADFEPYMWQDRK